MATSDIYSIGHGHKTIEEFIEELKSFNIEYVIDVRSTPFSKWAGHFNKGVLENTLKMYNIRYVYMGDVIGGRPLNDFCFDENGFFDYKKMAEQPSFIEGLSRLVTARTKGCVVSVMCSEAEPFQCHRSKLIGRELYFKYNINMKHILAPKKIITEVEVLKEISKSWTPDPNLFGEVFKPYFKSSKIYKKEMEEEYEY